LNALFAGEFKVTVKKNITFVDFENAGSSKVEYDGLEEFVGNKYLLTTVGSTEIQSILANIAFGTRFAEYNSTIVPVESMNSVNDSGTLNFNTILKEQNSTIKVSTQVIETESAAEEKLPSAVNMIAPLSASEGEESRARIAEKCAKLNRVFRDYGIRVEPIDQDMVQETARFTRFPVKLKSGETINSLNKYKNDIGIQLEASGEILIEHIKGTSYISVDVPFAGAGSSISLMKHLSILDSVEGRLNVIAGQKPDGDFEILDIADAPHMLIAGTTGSGKTIFLQSMLVSLLHQFGPDEIELLIVDPKQTDFIFFDELPHLYGGHVVIDAEEALEKLQRINEVDKEERTKALRACRSKDIDSYNQKNPDNQMKRMVVVIDEYSDLIQAAEINGTRKKFESNLLMLLQRVRNLGIHLIIATQRPSAQIVTGKLKAVVPFRVSFRLPSHTDSQTILDMTGAENLLGKGDMLIKTDADTMRMQGLFVSEDELEKFLEKLR